MKFVPLITIIKQKEVKKTLNNMFSRKLSKKNILVLYISKFKIITENVTIIP